MKRLTRARLRALSNAARPLLQADDWQKKLAERQRINAKLEAMLAEVGQGRPLPLPTDEDRARWARENDEFRQRNPAAWRERQRINAILESLLRQAVKGPPLLRGEPE